MASPASAVRGAHGHAACRNHTDLAEMLDRKFAERPNELGLQANGHLVEVSPADDGTSWTMVITSPDGWSCIVAVGESWEALRGPISDPLA